MITIKEEYSSLHIYNYVVTSLLQTEEWRFKGNNPRSSAIYVFVIDWRVALQGELHSFPSYMYLSNNALVIYRRLLDDSVRMHTRRKQEMSIMRVHRIDNHWP